MQIIILRVDKICLWSCLGKVMLYNGDTLYTRKKTESTQYRRDKNNHDQRHYKTNFRYYAGKPLQLTENILTTSVEYMDSLLPNGYT